MNYEMHGDNQGPNNCQLFFFLSAANLRQVGTVTHSRGMFNRMFNTAYSRPLQCFRSTRTLSVPATLLGLTWLRGRFISWVPVTSADDGEKKESSWLSIIRSWFCNNSQITLEMDRVHPEPPVLYKPRSKNVKSGTFTIITVGERNPNKPNKTILLVGETGAGKSTLINALVNYTMGVKWEDEVWFKIVEEEEKSQSESQTSDVIVYEIFGFEDETLPYSLTIIDTPGYGDTRGKENENMISQQLLDLFRSDDGVNEVHAVGLVMKASENRLTDRLKNVFSSVISLFGKNLEKNIVALFTHSDGVTPENALEALEAAKIKCAKNEKKPVCFLFNNCQHKQRTEEQEQNLKAAHGLSEKGMRGFIAFLGKTAPQKLEKTKEVLDERQNLQNLIEKIQAIEMKQTERTQILEGLKKNQSIVEIDETYKVKEPINGGEWGILFYDGATSCQLCEETCHYPCTTAWCPEMCGVMKNGCCIVCINKCPASAHVKEMQRYVTKTRRVKKTWEEINKKYRETETERENKSSLMENIKKQINQLTAEKLQLLDESYQHVVRLEEIALKADSVSDINYLDFLIEKMNEIEKVQKLKEMRSRMKQKQDKGTRNSLH
uniref:AIG1-type G domain-containing protein n=1 Tax=Astatotilapia calliptera TaxID=8154 RepID=A0AAX7SQ44_ASTCA